MIRFKTIGAGPCKVIVLHEWLGDHANWEALWPFIDGDVYSFTFADFRGYGWSSDITGDYTLKEASSDVFELIDFLGYKKCQIIGHSMSGLVSQKIALDYPDIVTGLVLFCPVPATGYKIDRQKFENMCGIVQNNTHLHDAILARGGRFHSDEWVAKKLNIAIMAASPEIKIAYLKMFTRSDIAADVVGSHIPITVIYGHHDVEPYQEAAIRRGFEGNYRNLKLIGLDNCGHYPMLEKPETVWGIMDKVMQSQLGNI